jgi:hypothetical protein
MNTPRCSTTSGPYRCDQPAGHQGPCESTEPAPAWAGPALRPRDAAPAATARDRLRAKRVVELQRALHALAFDAREEDRHGSA